MYRLFRNGDLGPDRLVSGDELFLGDKDVNNDFGQALYCLGTGDDRRKNVRKLYRRLGVNILPDAGQIVAALSRLPREPRNDDLHKKLVDALTGFSSEPLGDVQRVDALRMKVLSCAKTYEPFERCFSDPDLGRPSRLSETSRERVVDNRIPSNGKLRDWIDRLFPGAAPQLRALAEAKLTREPEPVEVGGTNVLDAWRDWLADLAIPGSVVRDEVEEQGFVVPSVRLQLIVVAKIHVRFCVPDSSTSCRPTSGRGRTCFTTRKAGSSSGGM